MNSACYLTLSTYFFLFGNLVASPSRSPTVVPSVSPTAIATSVLSTSCPPGWSTSTDRCYLLGSGDMTWQACKTLCANNGGYLPCIRSAAETAFIYNLHPTTTGQCWIGLNDIAVEGTYVWDDGCSNSYWQWSGSNPDNYLGAEDCGSIYLSPNSGWNDQSCTSSMGCTCEKQFSSTGNVCPAGWTLSPDGTTCYLFDNAYVTYSACQSNCQANSASMLCIQDSVQNAFLWSMRKTKRSWIGLNRLTTSGWSWQSGCTSTYLNWGANEGTTSGEYVVAFGPSTNGQWSDYSTSVSSLCTCQKPALIGSAAPTTSPSTVPTVSPSRSPTASPSVNAAALSSPTYGVKSGFAFAAVGSDGSVRAWGEAAAGGDSSTVTALLTAGVVKVVSSRGAFAALNANGTVVPWGLHSAIRDDNTAHQQLLSLVANEAAFAGVTTNGTVYTIGAHQNGGNVLDDAKCNGLSAQLTSGVVSITASSASFTALKADGSVYTWGNKYCGGGVSTLTMPALAGVAKVVASSEAFAALLTSGAVKTWGGKYGGGDSSAVASQLASGVEHIIAAKSVFVAFKTDTSIVAWGYGPYGGDSSAVASALTAGVKFVAHTFMAIAALKMDGSVVAWGDRANGGDASAVQSLLFNVATIVGNGYAFAALTNAGGVVAWGNPAYGGVIPASQAIDLSSGVVSIYHANRAFAALKADGSVVVWGQAGHGGSPGAAVEALLVSGVHTICSNDAAFSAIKTDGSVVSWGHKVSVPIAGLQFSLAALQNGVVCA